MAACPRSTRCARCGCRRLEQRPPAEKSSSPPLSTTQAVEVDFVAVRVRHVQIEVGVAVPRHGDLHVAEADGDVLDQRGTPADRPPRRHPPPTPTRQTGGSRPRSNVHASDQPLRGGAVRQVDLVVAEARLADRNEQLVGAWPRLDVQEERAAGHVDVVARHRHGGSSARLRHVLEPRHAGGVAHVDRRDDGPDEGERVDGDRELELGGLVVFVPRRVGHVVGAGLGRRAAELACARFELQPRDLRSEGIGQGARAAGGGGQDEGSDLLVHRVGLGVVHGRRERRRPDRGRRGAAERCQGHERDERDRREGPGSALTARAGGRCGCWFHDAVFVAQSPRTGQRRAFRSRRRDTVSRWERRGSTSLSSPKAKRAVPR